MYTFWHLSAKIIRKAVLSIKSNKTLEKKTETDIKRIESSIISERKWGRIWISKKKRRADVGMKRKSVTYEQAVQSNKC